MNRVVRNEIIVGYLLSYPILCFSGPAWIWKHSDANELFCVWPSKGLTAEIRQGWAVLDSAGMLLRFSEFEYTEAPVLWRRVVRQRWVRPVNAQVEELTTVEAAQMAVDALAAMFGCDTDFDTPGSVMYALSQRLLQSKTVAELIATVPARLPPG